MVLRHLCLELLYQHVQAYMNIIFDKTYFKGVGSNCKEEYESTKIAKNAKLAKRQNIKQGDNISVILNPSNSRPSLAIKSRSYK